MAQKDRIGNTRHNRGAPARSAAHPKSQHIAERNARIAQLDTPQKRRKPRHNKGPQPALVAAE